MTEVVKIESDFVFGKQRGLLFINYSLLLEEPLKSHTDERKWLNLG